MNLIDLLSDELEYTINRDDWYTPLNKALAGLTAEQAAWKPAGENMNSIWEITAHLLYYKEFLLLRLQGETPEHLASNNDDTFNCEGTGRQEWEALVNKINGVNRDLQQHLQKMTESDLENDQSKKMLPLWKHISGVIRHDAHHVGQIVLIRKLQGSWAVQYHEQ